MFLVSDSSIVVDDLVTKASLNNNEIDEIKKYLDDNETISIYPNPSSGIFYINKTVKLIQIIDIKGNIIKNLKNSKEFNITNQKNGLYLVHIINKEKVIIKKIIKN